MPKLLVTCALESEINPDDLLEVMGDTSDIHLIFTGVGKVNAIVNTLRALDGSAYDAVVNVGTAGSDKYGGLECGVYIDRDLYDNWLLDDIVIDEEKAICATGDSFCFQPEFDIVDMEAYAIARLCQYKEIRFFCYKFFTDNGSIDEWQKNIGLGSKHFARFIQSVHDKLSME